MNFGVLGTLSVQVDGTVATPRGPKLRKILSLLMLHFDSSVPVSALIRELWEDEPPSSHIATLHTHIMHLRQTLAAAAGISTREISQSVIITRPGGYLFRTGGGNFDLQDYERLLAAGREALRNGRSGEGIDHLRRALGLWRGPALADVPAGPLVESRIRQLEESRLIALQECVEAQIGQGRYQQAIMQLAAVTAENPLHEGLHVQHMRALCLDGRRAEALTMFRQLRATLIAEIGLEPGPSAQRLQREILTGM
jgi:SARP family transcriptional regulator, regulator of embCAB operon